MADLTDLKITRLKATGSDYALRDGAGLYLRVSKRGSKTFVYRYRSASGRSVWLTVGAYGAVSLHEARQQAAEYALMRKPGQDPAEHDQARIAVTEAVAAERAMVPTFENIIRIFLSAGHSPPSQTPRTVPVGDGEACLSSDRSYQDR